MAAGDAVGVIAAPQFISRLRPIERVNPIQMPVLRADGYIELHRLRGFRFKRLLIVGAQVEVDTGRYRSGISPAAVRGTLAAFEIRYDLPVVVEPDPQAAAALVCRWATYFTRELFKTVQAMTPPAMSWPPPEADTETFSQPVILNEP